MSFQSDVIILDKQVLLNVYKDFGVGRLKPFAARTGSVCPPVRDPRQSRPAARRFSRAGPRLPPLNGVNETVPISNA